MNRNYKNKDRDFRFPLKLVLGDMFVMNNQGFNFLSILFGSAISLIVVGGLANMNIGTMVKFLEFGVRYEKTDVLKEIQRTFQDGDGKADNACTRTFRGVSISSISGANSHTLPLTGATEGIRDEYDVKYEPPDGASIRITEMKLSDYNDSTKEALVSLRFGDSRGKAFKDRNTFSIRAIEKNSDDEIESCKMAFEQLLVKYVSHPDLDEDDDDLIKAAEYKKFKPESFKDHVPVNKGGHPAGTLYIVSAEVISFVNNAYSSDASNLQFSYTFYLKKCRESDPDCDDEKSIIASSDPNGFNAWVYFGRDPDDPDDGRRNGPNTIYFELKYHDESNSGHGLHGIMNVVQVFPGVAKGHGKEE